MNESICKNCNTSFTPKKKKGKFCCKECYWESMRKLVDIECLYCKNIYSVKPNQVKKRKYCSPKCRTEARKTLIKTKCSYCAKIFELYKKRIEKFDNNFCSKECYGKWMHEFGPKNEKHPR
jgi:hypothetical protein